MFDMNFLISDVYYDVGSAVNFFVICRVIKLSVSFFCVVCFVQHDHCGPFVCRLYHDIIPLSEVFEGRSFFGWEVVSRFFGLVINELVFHVHSDFPDVGLQGSISALRRHPQGRI